MARGADGSLLSKEQLDKLNLDRFNQAVADGNLYNTGPIGVEGTSFSPERWDDYFKKNPEVKPKDYTNQKDMQAQLDAGEAINTDHQEFVVDKNDVEVLSEEDMAPSYPARGKDNSFLTAEQAKSEANETSTQEASESATKQKSELANEVEADMNMEAEIEADSSTSDEFDSPVSEWVKEFESMSDEEFASAKLAIEQLPANAQEAYAAVAQTKDDVAFEDALAKGAKANQDKIDDITSSAPTESEVKEQLSSKTQDAKDQVLSSVEDALIDIEYNDRIKEIDDLYDGTMEKKGMLTTNVDELGEAKGDAAADTLLRDQAKDFEISDMKDKDREITTTIMKDTGLDMNQANALMGKLKGLCG